MKKISTIFILLLNGYSIFGQSEYYTYSKDSTFQIEVKKSEANFSKKYIYHDNGTYTIEIMTLKSDKLIKSNTFKDVEPMGISTIKNGKIKTTIDYGFNLIYSKDTCISNLKFKDAEHFFIDDASIGYIAPVINGYKNIFDYIVRNIHYPASALENDFMGKVYVNFTLSKLGVVENVIVYKGVYIALDKESARVIRNLNILTPAKLKGEPIELCISIPISYEFN